MKYLLSKARCCYKIHTLLIEILIFPCMIFQKYKPPIRKAEGSHYIITYDLPLVR